MRRPRATAGLLALLLLCVATTRASQAGDAEGLEIIVNPKNPVTAIERDFLRDAYLRKATQWGNGTAVLPIDLPAGAAARSRFARDVVKKTPQQLKCYWSQQIFSGKGGPPPEASSAAALIAYVLAHPGAVGYVPVDVDVGGTKVVPLR